MTLKPSLSIHEQLELLVKRGMIIDNEQQATSFLKTNHYYRLNIYFHKLLNLKDQFNQIYFSNEMAIYKKNDA